MRQFDTRADYYMCILESAQKALEIDPEDVLYRQVTANISGGHRMWDYCADELFENPKTLDEALLALEMRTVLEFALENQLKVVRCICRSNRVNLNNFGLPMDFGILLESTLKLAKRNVATSMNTKIEMATIAQRISGCSLADFLSRYCIANHDDGDYYCAQF